MSEAADRSPVERRNHVLYFYAVVEQPDLDIIDAQDTCHHMLCLTPEIG